jgi:regulator of sirC expression with transglutaminase-like and TPR domain
MSAWLTIGALDGDDWQPKFGGQWRQRAGRIIAEGKGQGFGGRTLCLSRRDVPSLPCEVAVTVRLRDESGAAGLIFHAADDTHYGFYPSNGQLRLTRFDGPDVFAWKVLEQKATPHYRPGEWNTLKVRLEKDRIRCFVNDRLVIESTDDVYTKGRAGLAKYRDTVAEFKHFRMGKDLPPLAPPAAVVARIDKTIDKLPAKNKPRAEVVQKLASDGPIGMKVMRERARRLEEQAAELRRLASAVHERNVLADLLRVLSVKEENIDLLHAALLIARLDNEDVDVEAYRHEVERMADRITARLPKNADDKTRLAALNKYLFEEHGFHGSRGDYYNRSNSYLSEVIDDREGIPITLSVLYIELARRLGVRLEGVGLPGHFVVRHVPAKGEPQLIDAYEGGQPLTREEAAKKVRDITDRPLREEHLKAVSKRAIVVRMLHNLRNVAEEEKDKDGMLRYLSAIVAVDAEAVQERAMRMFLRYQTGDREGALQDVDWLLEHKPQGLDVERVREFRRLLMQSEK